MFHNKEIEAERNRILNSLEASLESLIQTPIPVGSISFSKAIQNDIALTKEAIELVNSWAERLDRSIPSSSL